MIKCIVFDLERFLIDSKKVHFELCSGYCVDNIENFKEKE